MESLGVNVNATGKMNNTSVKVMDYFARKARKIQSLRGHDEQPPTPALGEEDVAYLRRVISAGEAAPPLPRRHLGPTSGDFEDNILQLVLYDDTAATAAGGAREGGERAPPAEQTAEEKKARKRRDRERGKMTKEELLELEKLVDNVKEQTQTGARAQEGRADKEKEEVDGKKQGRFASLLSKHKKDKDGKVPPPSPGASPDPEEIDREAEDLANVLDKMNLSSASKGPFSFTKSSVDLIQEFNMILKDLMNGVPTAYDDLTTLLDDKDNSMNRTYKKLPPFLQKLIAGVPKKVGAKATGLVNETQAAVGAKQTETGSSIMSIAQSFLGVATLKELVTNPAGVKGALVTILNALKLRFPAFVGAEVLLSLSVFILLFSFWYCHKRGREVRVAAEKEKAMLEGRATVLAIEEPKPESDELRDRSNRSRRSDESQTDRSRLSHGERSTLSDESHERQRRERRRRRRAEDEVRRSREERTSGHKPSLRGGVSSDISRSVEPASTRDRRPRASISDVSSETDSEEERRRARRRRRRRERRLRELELEDQEEEIKGSGRRDKASDVSRTRDRSRDRETPSERGSERAKERGSERHRERDGG